jgi:hypothetical protein
MTERDPHDRPGGQPHDDYERTDVNLRGIVLSGIALAVTTVAVLIAMVLMFHYYSAREGGSQGVIPLPPSHERGQQWPAQPRLEGLPDTPEAEGAPPANNPPQDYGWVDEKQQIVRIPVADEIPLALKKLPSSAPAPASAGEDPQLTAERSQPPSAANSGRIVLPPDSNRSTESKSP